MTDQWTSTTWAHFLRTLTASSIPEVTRTLTEFTLLKNKRIPRKEGKPNPQWRPSVRLSGKPGRGKSLMAMKQTPSSRIKARIKRFSWLNWGQRSSASGPGISTLTLFRSTKEDSWQVDPTLDRFTFGKSTSTIFVRGNLMATTSGSILSSCTRRRTITANSLLPATSLWLAQPRVLLRFGIRILLSIYRKILRRNRMACLRSHVRFWWKQSSSAARKTSK